MSDLNLREQVMVNHMVSATGCGEEQAKQLLQATQWQFEAALSLFLQGQPMPSTPSLKMTHNSRKLKPVLAPANTPATPPNFPETLISFSRLTASDQSGN